MFLIRSQDKRHLANNIELDICENEYTKLFEIYNKGVVIAEYSTEEKAIKVLDMICGEVWEPFYANTIDENEVAIYKNIVFNMPQDNEVN